MVAPPKYLRVHGHLYRLADPLVELRAADLDDVVNAFNQQMEAVVKVLGRVSELLIEADKRQAAGDRTFFEDIREAGRKTYNELLKEILLALDISYIVADKMPAKPMLQQLIKYKGAFYRPLRTAVQSVHEDTGSSELHLDCQTALANIDQVIEEAGNVYQQAKRLQKEVKHLDDQSHWALEHGDKEMQPNEVDALQPQRRIEDLDLPMRAMEKSSKSMRYSVDASISSIRHILHQLDALVTEWQAARDMLNAPIVPKDLTKPMVMTENPAAVFDELGGL